VDVRGSIWAIGDVAGLGEYTHLANHHADVVADHLVGGGTRRFDDVVTPACVFTAPPVMMVGPSVAELREDDDVVWVSAELSEIARWSTDDLTEGVLWIAVRRSTRRVIAAHGVGARFDELASALVTAIDGDVPVDRLAASMQPFPTVGELLGVAYSRAAEVLASS
jgi:pyruvate/2-oxoglutarate dehydrogenase complex dihydrolipoamide dehydrogenase (E3) component